MFLLAADRCFSVAMETTSISPGNRCRESPEGKPQITRAICHAAARVKSTQARDAHVIKLAYLTTTKFELLIK